MGIFEDEILGSEPITAAVSEESPAGDESQYGGASRQNATGHTISKEMLIALSVTGALLGAICLVLAIVALRRKCYPRKHTFLETDFDGLEGYTSKSAPSTRSSSPHIARKSSLNMDGTGNQKALLMRSLTVDMIPDFHLPPERVQPRSPGDRKSSESALQYQHSMLGNVQPDLYMTGAWSSVDEGDVDLPPSPQGRLWFSIVYDAAVEELAVHLIKAKYLKPREKTNAARDPFVRLYLLPDDKSCQESKTRKKTQTPKFNETFTFKVAAEEVNGRTLRLSIYDVDKRRVRHSLGHVLLPLNEVDLTKPDVLWKDLEPLTQSSMSLGEINLSLCYTPATEKLKVVVLRCRNLKKLDYDADESVHVRLQLMYGQRVQKTKRTDGQRGTCDPVYNESFAFNVLSRQIEGCAVVATVLVSGTSRLGGHDEIYGKVTVGAFMYARGEDLMHWQEMLAQPRNAIARWHRLTNAPVGHD